MNFTRASDAITMLKAARKHSDRMRERPHNMVAANVAALSTASAIPHPRRILDAFLSILGSPPMSNFPILFVKNLRDYTILLMP